MKLKRLPEDFQVDELSDFAPSGTGDFALYRLTKRGMGTLEVIEAIVQRWRIERRCIAYAGLKDRHAISRQLVTIRRGPRRDLEQKSFTLAYLGQVDHAYTAGDFRGNRFRIVVRSLSNRAAEGAAAALEEIRRDGLPNYFDDQRFGSVGESGEFVARSWIAGDFERALWLALAEPNPVDRPRQRADKEILRQRWGDWLACKDALGRSHARSIVMYLTQHATDFRGAFARLGVDLRGLYLSAFQSHLWNNLLATFLRETCTTARLTDVRLRLGAYPFLRALGEPVRRTLHETSLPLPAARARVEPGPVHDLVERSLAELDLRLEDLRIRYPRDSFFIRGERAAVVQPTELSFETDNDELYDGRRKLTLAFDLPRGSYATVLVKRITVAQTATRQPR